LNLPWQFVDSPVHRGAKSVKVSAKELGQVVLSQAKQPLKVGAGDKLFAHVYIDPKSPPREIMLQWHTSGWVHRAYWGENVIPWGRDNSPERRKQGALPAAGKWARLEVPVAQVGIRPGVQITGIAFTVHGGTAYFDNAGLVTQTPQLGGGFETLTAWLRVQKAAKGAGLPADIVPLINV